MRLGRKYRPPPSGMRPRLTNEAANRASGAAMMKSQASAMSRPSPIAGPLTAAIVIWSAPASAVTNAAVWCCLRQPRIATSPAGCSSRRRMPLTSPPAQNALPAPVRMITRTSSSSDSAASSTRSASRMPSSSAFRACGRFRVSTATGPFTARRTSEPAISDHLG